MPKLHRKLYDQVFDAILRGDIAPGTRLSEEALANLYGVSRSVVRRTLQRLFDEGIVDIRPNRGASVKSVDALDARAIFEARRVVDLAAALTGGVALACSDAHYGSMQNLLAPGRGINMGDGWETRRRREPGFDWVIVELGHPGVIDRIEVDTAHFKGNYPDRCSLQAAFLPGAPLETVIAQSIYWSDLLTEQKLSADHVHVFEVAAEHRERVSHVRFNIVPDGGVSRLRLFGTPAHG